MIKKAPLFFTILCITMSLISSQDITSVGNPYSEESYAEQMVQLFFPRIGEQDPEALFEADYVTTAENIDRNIVYSIDNPEDSPIWFRSAELLIIAKAPMDELLRWNLYGTGLEIVDAPDGSMNISDVQADTPILDRDTKVRVKNPFWIWWDEDVVDIDYDYKAIMTAHQEDHDFRDVYITREEFFDKRITVRAGYTYIVVRADDTALKNDIYANIAGKTGRRYSASSNIVEWLDYPEPIIMHSCQPLVNVIANINTRSVSDNRSGSENVNSNHDSLRIELEGNIINAGRRSVSSDFLVMHFQYGDDNLDKIMTYSELLGQTIEIKACERSEFKYKDLTIFNPYFVPDSEGICGKSIDLFMALPNVGDRVRIDQQFVQTNAVFTINSRGIYGNAWVYATLEIEDEGNWFVNVTNIKKTGNLFISEISPLSAIQKHTLPIEFTDHGEIKLLRSPSWKDSKNVWVLNSDRSNRFELSTYAKLSTETNLELPDKIMTRVVENF